MPGVPAGSAEPHARHDLRLVVHQRHDAGIHQRHEVLLQVAGPVPLVRVRGIFPLRAVGDVLRLGKPRHDLPVRPELREPAHVIEMQMAGEHDVDVVGRQPRLSQRVVEVIPAIELVDLGALRVHLVAAAGVDQQRRAAVADDQRPHAQGNPVGVVRRQPLFPQRARHDAEHGAAIEPEKAVGQRQQLEAAQRVPADGREEGDRGGRLLELDQHPVRRRRMDERHHRALRAGTRPVVDQPDAARLQVRQRGFEVFDP